MVSFLIISFNSSLMLVIIKLTFIEYLMQFVFCILNCVFIYFTRIIESFMFNKKFYVLTFIVLFCFTFAAIAYYMRPKPKINDIKEIPSLFKSGAYDINNDRDLRKLAKRLTSEQIMALAKDIEENPYTYYDEEKTAIWIVGDAALTFYTIAAEQGIPEMQYKISTFHLDLGNLGVGIDLPKEDLPWIDSKTGKNWLQLAFENNYPKAIEAIIYYCLPSREGTYSSKSYYYEGRDRIEETMPLDIEHCKGYLEKAYNQKIAKPYEMALIYYYTKDYKTALKYINESLEYFKTDKFKKEDQYWQMIYKGFINYLIGNLYYYGYEYPQDYKKAMEYYSKAEEESDAVIANQAAIKIDYMYKNGLGVRKDLSKVEELCISYFNSDPNPILEENGRECYDIEQYLLKKWQDEK